MSKLKRTNRSTSAYYLLSFLIPTAVMIVLCRHFTTAEPDGPVLSMITGRISQLSKTIFEAVRLESETAQRIREVFASGTSVDRVNAVRELLGGHFDPFFIILTLLGTVSFETLRLFFFVRFGLAGVSMYHCVRAHIKCNEDASLLLSVAYSISVVMLTAGQNIGLMNLMIMAPILISCIDSVIRSSSFKAWVLLSIAVFGALTCGVFVYVNVALFVIGVGLVIIGGITPRPRLKRLFRLVSATFSGYLLGLVTILPALKLVTNRPEFISSFKEGTVRFKLLDMLTMSIDGRTPVVNSSDSIPPFALSVIVMFFVVLFFANKIIPYRMKVASIFTLLLFYLACAYTGMDYLFGIWGMGGAYVYARVVLMSSLLVFLAGISIRNISTLEKHGVHITIALMLALVVLSNVSVQENRPKPVSLLLSAITIIVVGCIVLHEMEAPRRQYYYFILLAELVLNFALVLGPAIFSPSVGLRTTLATDTVRTTTEFRVEDENILPLLNSDDSGTHRYIVLSSDLGDLGDDIAYPERVNMMSRAAMGDNIFERVDTDILNLEGITSLGMNRFAGDNENHGVITFRAYMMGTPGAKYFAYSGFLSRQNVVELYDDSDIFSVFEGPFMMSFNPRESSVAMKLSIETPGSATYEYSVWSMNERARTDFNNKVNTFSDYEFTMYTDSFNMGGRSVVTSIDYTDELNVYINGHKAMTHNICDKLSFTVNGVGGDELQISIVSPSEDITAGIVISGIYALMIIGLYIYSSKKKKGSGERTCAAEK